MDILAGLLIRILKSKPASDKGTEKMSIIIRRPYAHLEEELIRIFNGQADVTVIVDRRYTERRTKKEPYPSERRRLERRRMKEELVEVVISI